MTDRATPTRIVGRDVVMLVALCAAMLLPGLGERDLWNPNEPIYGLAVREMAERGDWLVPTVQGLEFAEKPILYFWLARAAGLVGGVDEWTLRLPSVLAATLLVVGTYLIVVPYSGAVRARWAGWIAITTYTVFWGGRTSQMDVWVGAATVFVLLGASRAIDRRSPPVPAWLLAGVAAGIGFLAKGPVAWVLPGIALVAWVVSTGRPRALLTADKVPGALVAVALPAAWIGALLAQEHGSFVHEVLLRQNFGRFVDAWDHDQPWWYYLKYVWTEMAPWAFLLAVAWALPDRSDDDRKLDRLAWAWLLGTILFFSLSDSKRSTYILPAAPAVAILVSGLVVRLRSGSLSRARRNLSLSLMTAIAVILGLLGAAVIHQIPREYPDLAMQAWILGVVLLGGAAAVITAVFSRRRGPRLVPVHLLIAVAVTFALGGAAVLPAVDSLKSARPFATELVACVGGDGVAVSYGLWRWRASYAYYAHRPFDTLAKPEDLTEWMSGPGRRFVLTERASRDEVTKVLGVEPVLSRRIGNNEALLFAVPPAQCATR